MPPFNHFGPHRPPTSGQPAKMLEFDGMGGVKQKACRRAAQASLETARPAARSDTLTPGRRDPRATRAGRDRPMPRKPRKTH